ncbi:hypothetical protein FJT64_003584 [Amphibalanus amphitrite]|uniref:Uncharacterized protein n=1 Tax=Amphibalanus amphitrite TaxID=1232801 RepID=A0A6A4W846_AMPAM|nr:hypothetical protein FJT64_003584 [Amphibalanus amphitrite]
MEDLDDSAKASLGHSSGALARSATRRNKYGASASLQIYNGATPLETKRAESGAMDELEDDEVVFSVAGVREQLTAVADWLGVRPGPRLVPAALSALLDSGLMADRDRAMAADLCSDQSRQPGTATTTDSFLLSVFLAVLAVAVWLPAWWLPLAAALLLCVGGAAVARLRVADGQRRVDEFCRAAGELKRAGLRCCRLLQESHLMARGVTL